MHYEVKALGKHRGNLRLWFETLKLADVGLPKGTRYDLFEMPDGTLEIRPDAVEGARVVSGKEKGGKTIPIIDINSSEALAKLGGDSHIKVVFDTVNKRVILGRLPSAELAKAREGFLAKGLRTATLAIAALCFGGGVMDHAAHAGLADAGLQGKLVAAVEIDADMLEHARRHNPVVRPDTRLYAAPMQELVQDRAAMASFPRADVLVTGIPCSGASISGKSKLGLACAEDHPQVGHMVVPYLMMVNQVQPAVAVVECVTRYQQTVSAVLMRAMFRDMGYTTQEVVLNAYDFGSPEKRERWFLVATTAGLSVDLTNLAPARRPGFPLGKYLDRSGEHRWSFMEGLKAKEVRDIADGKGFRMQLVDETSTSIGVIGKDYTKSRSTEPKVVHPDGSGRLRLLTPAEHAAIKNVPVSMLGDLADTPAHQMLGQSVDVRPVQALFKRIGEGLNAWAGGGAGVDPVWAGRAAA